MIHVIIPAFNEEEGIVPVLTELRELEISIENIIVVDNSSTDKTAERARALGAIVLHEPQRGYGAACLRGIHYLQEHISAESRSDSIVVFLDADYSDYPDDVYEILAPIESGKYDFVIGSRLQIPESRNAVPPIARFGNTFASVVMRFLYGVQYTDMGPFRAITWPALLHLRMRDRTWGWTLEMQMKAAQSKVRTTEVAVRYRERVFGKSKISQSFIGASRAAAKILWVMGTHAVIGEQLPEYKPPAGSRIRALSISR